MFTQNEYLKYKDKIASKEVIVGALTEASLQKNRTYHVQRKLEHLM